MSLDGGRASDDGDGDVDGEGGDAGDVEAVWERVGVERHSETRAGSCGPTPDRSDNNDWNRFHEKHGRDMLVEASRKVWLYTWLLRRSTMFDRALTIPIIVVNACMVIGLLSVARTDAACGTTVPLWLIVVNSVVMFLSAALIAAKTWMEPEVARKAYKESIERWSGLREAWRTELGTPRGMRRAAASFFKKLRERRSVVEQASPEIVYEARRAYRRTFGLPDEHETDLRAPESTLINREASASRPSLRHLRSRPAPAFMREVVVAAAPPDEPDDEEEAATGG